TLVGNLAINIDGLAVDTQYSQLKVNGTVDLTGAGLSVTGSYNAAVGDSFTIVSATNITGTLDCLPDSSIIQLNGQTWRGLDTGTPVTLVKLAAPPSVIAVVVNDGPVQRSRVTQIRVDFSEPIVFAGSPAAAFQLKRQSDNAVVDLTASVMNDTTTHV